MSASPDNAPEPDLGRLTSFTDNVLSVAITLLVFNVGVPADWTHLELAPAIRALAPRVLSFALSFFVIGVYWVGHHIMFRVATHASRQMLWFNNLFLMMVCLLPASAALLGNFPDSRAAVVIYGVNLLSASIALTTLWICMIRVHARLGAPIDPEVQWLGKRRMVVGMIFAIAGIGLAWVNPWLSYAIYYVAPLSFVYVQFV